MAVQFDLFENPQREGSEIPQFHAKVITKDVVTTKNMRQSISRKCTVTSADVSGVLAALGDEIYQALSNGYSVHIDELGYFSLGLKCSPDINPKHVSASDVSVRTVNFTPSKEFLERFRTVKMDRYTTHGHHSSRLDEAELKERLVNYFGEHQFISRREFEKLTGFNQTKSLRYLRQLIDDGILHNAGSRYQPVYVKGENFYTSTQDL